MLRKIINFAKKTEEKKQESKVIPHEFITKENHFCLQPLLHGNFATARKVVGKKYYREICLWNFLDKKIMATIPIYTQNPPQSYPFKTFPDGTLACNFMEHNPLEKQDEFMIAVLDVKNPTHPKCIKKLKNYKNSMITSAQSSHFVKLNDNFLFANYCYSRGPTTHMISGRACTSESWHEEMRVYDLTNQECILAYPDSDICSAFILSNKQIIILSHQALSFGHFKNKKLIKEHTIKASQFGIEYGFGPSSICLPTPDEKHLLILNSSTFYILDIVKKTLEHQFDLDMFLTHHATLILPNNNVAIITKGKETKKIEIWDFFSDIKKPKRLDVINTDLPNDLFNPNLMFLEGLLIYSSIAGIQFCVLDRLLQEEIHHLQQVKTALEKNLVHNVANMVVDYAKSHACFFYGKQTTTPLGTIPQKNNSVMPMKISI